MNYDTTAIVQSVQRSVANLLALVEQASRGRAAEDEAALRGEARKTALMMIAAIVLADQKYADGERAFVNLLLDWGQRPGGEMPYLTEHAEAWKEASMHVPRFFRAAADHDERLHTDVARAMIREIRLIGDNASISDGHYGAIEHEVVQRYVAHLERFLAAGAGQHRPTKENSAEGWTIV